ncbi:FMN-binding negative transcriptional regulator [Flaviaesturariibacter terrae]
MYNLPEYKEQDPQLVLRFIREHPFATIIGVTKEGAPVATQIPVFIEEREGKLYLSGHMMRKLDHQLAFEENPQTLCVFTGAHTYVSATWYSNPQQGSTWNYQAVHVRGTMRFLDEEGLIAVLRKTSLHFEGGNAASATVYDNLPAAYTGKMLKAIAGFEVAVTDIQHVFKLSQNRDRESYGNIIEQLKQQDADAREVARIMEERTNKVYPEA